MKGTAKIVLFGGDGDLSYRKLIPALYRAYTEGSFSEDVEIVLSCRDDDSQQECKAATKATLIKRLASDEQDELAFDRFIECVTPVSLDVTTHDHRWQPLVDILSTTENRIFYMAIPPSLFGATIESISQAKLIGEQTRIVMEKPIGYDGKSAEQINGLVSQYFTEEQIYRIDHYLGKETVQNLMALRFSNSMFEQIWNRNAIDHVQISLCESVGLGSRASFYDGAGAMRDMVQNHLLQLLCLIAMEPPNKLNAENIRAEKVKVLKALRPLEGTQVAENVVLGQYVSGAIDGKTVGGYVDDLGCMSDTETFVAIEAYIDNWRWSRVPFYLRTGKRMKQRGSEIVIQFKEVSHNVYDQSVGPMQPNQLVIRLQPSESIEMMVMTKDLSQLDTKLMPVSLNLNFSDTYKNLKSDAYKRLLLDVVNHNPALFIHRAEINSAWAWIDPIIAYWAEQDCAPDLYRSGTWGPQSAERLIGRSGRQWHNEE